jgi:hypothetical protein
MKVSTDFSFSAESFVAEGHPYYERDFEFSVTAHVYPREPACWEHPAEGGEVEDVNGSLIDAKKEFTADEVKAIELWFHALVRDNVKMRDWLYEQLGQELEDMRARRGYDG